MSYEEQNKLESTYMMKTYGRKPVEFVRGEGMRLYDSEDKEYLDFLSGIGVVSLGHNDPVVTEAIATQAKKLLHVGNYFYVEGRGELAAELSSLLNDGDTNSPVWKSFFANSGAEANEGAIKLVRKYGKAHLQGAGTILTAKRSFHGRTLMTTAATAQDSKQASFAPMPLGFSHFDPTDTDDFIKVLEVCVEAAKQAGSPELAPVAVMLECVQGEGGVWPLEEEYLQNIRRITYERGLLLIIDEVQSGLYRTGVPFSFMHAGIRPDVVTIAKGIGNGFPCGVVAATGKAADTFVPGEHGSTFGGSPLAIAAATATLAELIRCNVGENVREMGEYLKSCLIELPHVTKVRGKGLMVGLSLDVPLASQIADSALERGMVINSIGDDIVRFLPPLKVGKAEIDALIAVLRELLEAL